jgi:hypothetical protein
VPQLKSVSNKANPVGDCEKALSELKRQASDLRHKKATGDADETVDSVLEALDRQIEATTAERTRLLEAARSKKDQERLARKGKKTPPVEKKSKKDKQAA